MASKKETLGSRCFNPIRDRFWAERYPQNPDYDHKDWADTAKPQNKRGGKHS